MFLCCSSSDFDSEDERNYSPRSVSTGTGTKLAISAPTDFRREEINIPGMSPEQERFVREKALADAKRMFQNLQPLRSSPSETFVERPATARGMSQPNPHPPTSPPPPVTYEQFTTPRAAPPRPNSYGQRLAAHTRKISDQFRKPSGDRTAYTSGAGFRGRPLSREGDSAVEMRALVDGAGVAGGARSPPMDVNSGMSPPLGKMSAESDGTWGSELDSAKGGIDLRA
ncbi:Hypothetical predicted protein [Lecanosticta acicola]|uniref:Uncharacterized protein n=1 Tax=Lecanosticta acicola TaxID=111012 RepID=A0AAI9EFZ9_9PEZI|nr:Hypothetical predicted protein [Lecanosticta acicola]